jgi:hypothetical protein
MPDELPLDADDDEEEGVVQAEMELDLPEEAEADKREDGETDKTDEASS